jgi:hypothetical protein
MLWRDMRGKTKEEIHKELQDLDLIGSPHLEEKMIGGNVDLDLLSLFPKKMQESWEGWGGRASSSRSTMEERENGSANVQMRKRGLYIAPARNLTVTGILTRKFWPRGRNFWPGGGISAPLIKFPAPLPIEGCTTAREKGLSKILQGRKLWNSGLGGGISGPGENINTKMVVTFASGLHFR